jgi:WD40 repeat protein
MGKKLLIASGTGNYDHPHPELQLPHIRETVDSVAALFTGRLGYSRVLEEISNDPTSDDLHKELDVWLGSGERDASDWVVFYYTGHGDLVADKLYLLTRDYENGRTSTAFSVEEFASMLSSKDASGENRKLKRCLIILDTCHSGAGTLGISHQIGKLLSKGGNGAMFYLLAASYPKQEALAGAMAEALIQSVEDPLVGGTLQPLLYFDQIVPAINRRLRSHQAVYSPVAAPDEEPQFFPNPRYIPGLPSGATVADIRRAVETGELTGFWDPISRGVELESQPGWYFTGRERVLRELSSWLKDPTDRRARVITGRPGSGKSAILARIVTLSDREHRQLLPAREERMLEAFPTGIIDLAIHAKGKTFQEIVDRLALHLKAGTSAAEVLSTLASRVQPFHVVVDALDEATDPTLIARDLLSLLLSLPKVKLLVGTRPEYANKLGTGTVQLQIDQSDYLEEADLANYVVARLLGQAQQAEKTPYQDDPELARGVAEAVAKRAYPNFLIARLVAEDLLARPQPISRDEIAQSVFPNSVGAAFEQYMARFGAEREKVRDLLVPLAWAGGLGLPWADVWPSVASGLSGHTYRDEDIRWVLDRAGSFVVEALEHDRSVYRLYHQALADHLRRGRDPVPTQRRIVKTLIQTVPGFADSARKDWRLAQPYILGHLAEHAAAGGILREVARDPLFLLTADADRLVAAMRADAQGVPPSTMQGYQTSLHLMKTNRLPERASYLEMGARKAMATVLANRISRLPLQRAWGVPWARWSPVSTHRILAQTGSSVRALAVTEWQGRTVVIAAVFRRISVWDLESGKEARPPIPVDKGFVEALAVAEWQGRTVVLAGSSDKTIRVWDVESGKEIFTPLAGHGSQVRTLARLSRLFRRDRAWDCPLAATEWQGRTVAISSNSDRTIHVWDLETGKEVCAPLIEQTGKVEALAVAEWQGRLAVVSGSSDQTIRVWDLETGREAYVTTTDDRLWIRNLAVAEWQGRTVFASAKVYEDIIRVWDLESGKEVSAPLTGHSSTVNTLAVVKRQGQTLVISGSSDETIRVWDLESGKQETPAVTLHTAAINTVAEAVWHGRRVVISGSSDATIRVWDVESGKEVRPPFAGHEGSVEAIAISEWQGRTVVISGSSDKTIRVWDLESGKEIRAPLTGHAGTIITLAVAERQGRTVVVSGSRDDHSIRVWDLETGKEAYAPLTGHRSEILTRARSWLVKRFKPHGNLVGTLVVAKRQGQTVVVSGSRIWSLDSGKKNLPTLADNRGFFSPLAVAERQGRTVVVSGISNIRVWDLDTGGEINATLRANEPAIDTLAVAKWQGRSVVLSGNWDNTIRISDLESGEILPVIDVGSRVNSIMFSAGSRIVAGTKKGLICVQLS